MEYREGRNKRAAAAPYRQMPLCTSVLVGINVIVFLAGTVAPKLGSWMTAQGSFSVVYLLYGQGGAYRLVTSAFLHADIEHLINNMLLLYCCGDIVERSLGRLRFLILYFGSAVCGNLLSAAFELSTGSFYSSIGASGAVFGLTGALLFLVIARSRAAAHISLQRALIAVFLSLYAGFAGAYVNNAAHVGGLLSGFLLGFLLSVIPPVFGRKEV
ncbi:MAG: rhomboid family intramembrane serine protease [Eubacteriales bacterium]|nr:rhomboid family intramembrane serine protease [Eubacteriales bacterium]